ncbi:UvrD-helicase domain-containing protein [Fluviicola sp.]|jgi:ATP-dependent exoDNAse (exonuclease V) beta subunit|uniref:UvrD-helicase domain-containing protein n=1 Tax=Fluviicola sp. TaxID=1917219 RepID=UPI00282D9EF7|nr:UvrD-helicase domain-containing protein [Fluviicola sp.]MDR0801004.1 UvrD-helicase domain-containing protein [Fluviicola sp.]
MNSEVSKPFLIVNASAGSGKTYNLVRNYLRLLLSEDDNRAEISQIIAMTFTNKASIEMKTRIMSDLNKLAHGNEENRNYLEEISKFVGITPEAAQKHARTVLRKILHQYEDFNVMTIDKFNLRLIRSFSKDLDLPENFEISLDDTLILEKAIDELLSNIDARNQTKLYLLALNFAKSNLEEENDWNLKKNLLSKAKILTNEGYFRIIRTLSKTDFNKEQLDLWKLQFKAEKELLQEKLRHLKHLFHDTGVDSNAFAGKTSTFKPIAFNLDLNPEPIFFLRESKRTDANYNNILKTIDNGSETQFAPAYLDFLNFVSEKAAYWIELDFKIQQFHILAILKELALSMDEIRNKESIIRVSEFNKLVAELVQNEDAPFIYERLGSRFNHFFLDEFQDTSRLQWLNIVPLVYNSLAGNYFNFIVGDPKQSIYRFKNGVAEQFIALPAIYNPENEASIEQRSHFFQQMGKVEGLEDNWRSAREIVEFNNRFFQELIPFLPEGGKEFYSHLKQNPKGKAGGYIEMILLPQKEINAMEFTNNQLLEWVEQCISDGYKPHEICVLGRKKRDCNQYANFLKSKGYQIVSSDSLLVNSDKHVQLAISYCKWKVNRFHFQHAMQFAYFYFETLNPKNSFALYNSCFREVAEENSAGMYFSEALFFENSHLNADFLDASFQNIYSLLMDFLKLLELDPIENTYLQQLLDIAYQFDISNGPDLMDFIQYYDKNETKFSVQLSENEHAIQIMTAHKSKGLEFPVVIIPSFHFFTEGNIQDSFLMEINEYIIETKMSQFESTIPEIKIEAEKEDAAKKMDAINLLYVAFTRPQDRLYAINLKGYRNSFYDKFDSVFHQLFPDAFKDEKMHLKLGQMPEIKHHFKNESGEYHPHSIQNFLWFPEISIQPAKEQTDDSLTVAQRIGKQFHFIMEKSQSHESAFSALQTGILKGQIEQEFEKTLAKLVNEAFQNEILAALFNSGKHLNERTLIYDSKTRLRPDKLIVSENSTLVIDFKTGERKRKHEEQVLGYLRVLKEIGMPGIKGYLYYTEGLGLVEISMAGELWD